MSEFVWVHPSQPRFICALGAGKDEQGFSKVSEFYLSEDGGATWTRREVPISLGMVAVDPDTTGGLYGISRDQTWHSQDKGQSWEPRGRLRTASLDRLMVHPLSGKWLWAWSEWKNGVGTWQSVDGGFTWRKISAITGEVWMSDNAGQDWTPLLTDKVRVSWVDDIAIDPNNSTRLYAATPEGVFCLEHPGITLVEGMGPAELPRVALFQNYPNPFNPQTTIAYQLPKAGLVRLTLYNVAGQVVRRLVDQVQAAGRYQVAWDSRDDQGREVGSGVYLCRLEAGPFQQTRRLVLLK